METQTKDWYHDLEEYVMNEEFKHPEDFEPTNRFYQCQNYGDKHGE